MLVWGFAVVVILLVVVVLYDVTQRQHAILRNFPVVGHFRYWLEAVGPELRQYIVTDNNEERPFSRDQRRWIYASAKAENNYFGFGSDNEMELQPHYLIIKHDTFPLSTSHPGDPEFDPQFRIPCAKIMGGSRQRRGLPPGIGGQRVRHELRLVERPGLRAPAEHWKGGVRRPPPRGISWAAGTGYFGAAKLDGRFSMARLKDVIARTPQIRAVEIKLSQGAKPGLAGCSRAPKSPLRSPSPRRPDGSRLCESGVAQCVPERG